MDKAQNELSGQQLKIYMNARSLNSILTSFSIKYLFVPFYLFFLSGLFNAFQWDVFGTVFGTFPQLFQFSPIIRAHFRKPKKDLPPSSNAQCNIYKLMGCLWDIKENKYSNIPLQPRNRREKMSLSMKSSNLPFPWSYFFCFSNKCLFI